MTMASLTASLLTRNAIDRPRRRGNHPARGTPNGHIGQGASSTRSGTTATHQLMAAVAPQQPVPGTPPPGKKVSGQARGDTTSAATRKAKTLRLDPRTDQQLRRTAARLGKTQQSIMEQGLKTLLDTLSSDVPCLHRIGEEKHDSG